MDTTQIYHGDAWVRKHDGQVAVVLMVCGTSGQITVSGYMLPGYDWFARQIDLFRKEHLPMWRDIDEAQETEATLAAVREAAEAHADYVTEGPDGQPTIVVNESPGRDLANRILAILDGEGEQ